MHRLVIAALIVALPLAGCGKKGAVQPPPVAGEAVEDDARLLPF